MDSLIISYLSPSQDATSRHSVILSEIDLLGVPKNKSLFCDITTLRKGLVEERLPIQIIRLFTCAKKSGKWRKHVHRSFYFERLRILCFVESMGIAPGRFQIYIQYI